MITAAINLTLIEFIVLPLVAIIFIGTIYFFIKSRKTLQETLRSNSKSFFTTPKEELRTPQKRSPAVEMEEQFARMRHKITASREEEPVVEIKRSPAKEENLVNELKNTISQQQKLLNSYLDRVEELENEGKEELNNQIQDLEREIHKLHIVIEKKDEEIEDLHQQASAAQKMAARIEEVYQEFEQLQEKMMQLEKQASRANNLAIELEDTRHSYEQVHKELMRKHEKLEEVMYDNQRMREQMNELEDKLSEANLQRQQLHKKVQFLTDLNNDMQNISETNKKMQTELRRIGELESMLNIMAEEREMLLKSRQQNKSSL